MSILDPYVKSKQRKYQDGLITTQAVQREEKQTNLFPAVPAPEDNPTCKTCGRRLYDYDVERGECFHHPVDRIRSAREKVTVTDRKGS